MNIWVFLGMYDGELFTSTHLTEKGACLAAIGDMLEFLNVGADYQLANPDGDELEWRFDVIEKMARPELWALFNEYSEHTWNAGQQYQISFMKTQVAA